MPATYDSIASNTLASTAATVTFSNINSNYTDLILVCTVRTATSTSPAASDSLGIYFNSTTGTSYSSSWLLGNGSVASSNRNSSAAEIYAGEIAGFNAAASVFSSTIIHIQNYSNTTTNKTVLCRSDIASAFASATVGLFRSTGAINSVTIRIFGGSKDMAQNSTFSLYGIRAA